MPRDVLIQILAGVIMTQAQADRILKELGIIKVCVIILTVIIALASAMTTFNAQAPLHRADTGLIARDFRRAYSGFLFQLVDCSDRRVCGCLDSDEFVGVWIRCLDSNPYTSPSRQNRLSRVFRACPTKKLEKPFEVYRQEVESR